MGHLGRLDRKHRKQFKSFCWNWLCMHMQDINPLDPAGMSWRLVVTVSCILCWKTINTLLEMALGLCGFDSAYRMENLRSSHFFRPHHRWRKRKLWWGWDCFLVLLNWFPRGEFTSRRKIGREGTNSAERADFGGTKVKAPQSQLSRFCGPGGQPCSLTRLLLVLPKGHWVPRETEHQWHASQALGRSGC